MKHSVNKASAGIKLHRGVENAHRSTTGSVKSYVWRKRLRPMKTRLWRYFNDYFKIVLIAVKPTNCTWKIDRILCDIKSSTENIASWMNVVSSHTEYSSLLTSAASFVRRSRRKSSRPQTLQDYSMSAMTSCNLLSCRKANAGDMIWCNTKKFCFVMIRLRLLYCTFHVTLQYFGSYSDSWHGIQLIHAY